MVYISIFRRGIQFLSGNKVRNNVSGKILKRFKEIVMSKSCLVMIWRPWEVAADVGSRQHAELDEYWEKL